MDSGAHFWRCDFQVHMPRDADWVGPRPVTDEERAEFAAGFARACREKGLNAVAITDHHDFAFVPFIREAAENELDDAGDPVPEDERLVVFPGLELTLGVPCQALLLLDADFPTDRLDVVLDALAIDRTPPDDTVLGPVQRLDHIDSLRGLYERLDAYAWLEGSYIVLPNVTDGGYGTLMRSGMQSKYKDMPCVGGYLDGTVSEKVGDGNRHKFAGADPAWGNKRIALFQTSDSRSDDFGNLGAHSTWVKWAEPTAEALRQACLAEESRIAHEPPQLPSTFVTRMSVSNSAFMGPIELEFNPQYNAFIGGRGTGKSTCLEYLRWALCDQTARPTDVDELPDHEARRRRLIAETLAPFDGHVDVHLSVNGLLHVVRRDAESSDVLLKVGTGEFEPASPEEIRALLPVLAYSQKQLSSVSVRVDELTRFVESPIRRQLDEITSHFKTLAGVIRENYAALQRHRALTVGATRDQLTARSLAEQAQNLRESLTGISDDDREIIEKKPEYDRVDGEAAALDSRLEQAIDSSKVFEAAVDGLVGAIDELEAEADEAIEGTTEPSQVAAMRDALRDGVQKLRTTASDAASEIQTLRSEDSDYTRSRTSWIRISQAFAADYEAAKARAEVHESQLEELAEIEARQRAAEERVREQLRELESLGSPEERHQELRREWTELRRQRTEAILDQCRELDDLSDGLIRAGVNSGRALFQLRDRFRGAVQGSNMRTAKIDQFFENLSNAETPIESWEDCLAELEACASTAEQGDEIEAPTLRSHGFSADDIPRIANRLSPDAWLDLALAIVDDEVFFEYEIKDGSYTDFAVASAGQQATALLRVLLAQGGPPLIIDQPEDDLDSQVILDVVAQIWKAKATRQLIFTSHNANLVVNGDAELVVCCDYRATADQSGGRIKLEGAIDVSSVRDEITTVMEGGDKAFKLRKDKYGF